jgi:chaperone protein EcpD
MKISFRAACAFGLFAAGWSHAHASIVINGTRIIYPAQEREVTVSLSNNGSAPRLLQVWVDDGDPQQSAYTAKAPFLVTPPMSRVDPHRGQTLRLMFTGSDVPQDRETTYWLNVLEVPPKPKNGDGGQNNYLQFAVRSRLKIFYRPKDLPGDPATAVEQLQWRLVRDGSGYAAECTNPGAYNVSFGAVNLKGVDVEKTLEPKGGMCPAKGKRSFPLKGDPVQAGGRLSLAWINDFGGFEPYEASYTP